MLLVDAHLDLAWNAIRWKRDLTRSVAELREAEAEESCFLRNALTQFGHFVEVVDNGDLAREKLQRGSFSILILDLNLPRSDGMEILRELRGAGRQPGIIFTSISPQPGDIEACKEFDRVEFLQKPYRLDELQTAISRISTAVMC